MTDPVESAIQYWQTVEQCLIKLYGFEPAAAQTSIARIRGRMTKTAVARDLTYHWDPLSVANDLAGAGYPIKAEVLSAYQKIADASVKEPLRRKARHAAAKQEVPEFAAAS